MVIFLFDFFYHAQKFAKITKIVYLPTHSRSEALAVVILVFQVDVRLGVAVLRVDEVIVLVIHAELLVRHFATLPSMTCGLKKHPGFLRFLWYNDDFQDIAKKWVGPKKHKTLNENNNSI